jgi:hypothetical protein
MSNKLYGSKKSIETQRKNKTGFFSKTSRIKSLETRRRNNSIPFCNKEFASKAGKEGVKTQIKNKIGFFNPKNQLKASIKGYNTMIKNKNIKIFNIFFGSKKEAEIGLCFNEQIEQIKKGINFQVSIGIYTLDFVDNINTCVMEVHEVIKYFDKNETNESYFKKRRNILDKSILYKNYNLVVIE